MKRDDTPGACPKDAARSAAWPAYRNGVGTAANNNRRSFLATLPDTLPKVSDYPWDVVSQQTLARLLGVNRSVLDRWRYRELLPPALPMEWLRGSRRFYRWASIDAWLSRGARTEADACRRYLTLLYGHDANWQSAAALMPIMTDWAWFRDRDVTFNPSGYDAYMADCIALVLDRSSAP